MPRVYQRDDALRTKKGIKMRHPGPRVPFYKQSPEQKGIISVFSALLWLAPAGGLYCLVSQTTVIDSNMLVGRDASQDIDLQLSSLFPDRSCHLRAVCSRPGPFQYPEYSLWISTARPCPQNTTATGHRCSI